MKLTIRKSFFYIGILVLFFCAQSSYAQHAYFVESGKIEFEKSVNMFAKLKNRVQSNDVFGQKIYDEYRKTQPQFAVSKSTLSFSLQKKKSKGCPPL